MRDITWDGAISEESARPRVIERPRLCLVTACGSLAGEEYILKFLVLLEPLAAGLFVMGLITMLPSFLSVSHPYMYRRD